MRQKLMLTKRRCLKKVKIKIFSQAAPVQGATFQNKGKMIVISNLEVTKGYEVWKKAFESNEAMRQKNN